ncbi:glycine betaine ABC transporter substrate-binding protein [Nocardioides panacis]|uniref:Glycine betaine ABC transporter substrate-binding protein n=1 Tax=Nocardioides panacis TaxID=2849501 RepID=A0A975Y268_9ACTN|nr:glycine betaine ABC transporter substrate-binding protein [Nocardioides panacis]QWZ10237.1 glycine betaine ABC transporter substrate-binding protein [Nocardioides panacis]
MTMHTNLRGKWVAGAAATGLAALALSGCGSLSESSSSSSAAGGGPCEGVEAGSVDTKALDGVTVKVGSKEFDEQLVLGQLTIKMMCAAGATVKDETNTKGSTQTRKKLIDGVSDVVWEYTGTGWINYLGHTKPISDPQAQYDAVKKEDLAKNKLVWGPLAPFNNTYAFAVTDEFGKKHNLETHSDMAAYIKANPDSTVCVESEFAARPDGYPGFKKTYGITGGKLKSLGTGVVYTQLDKGNCDFGEIFTTDGRLAALGLQILDDDKGYFPLYNGVTVTRADFDKAHPEMLEVLKPLADVLDTETMTQLNKKISSDGLPADKIAEDYLTEKGFLK